MWLAKTYRRLDVCRLGYRPSSFVALGLVYRTNEATARGCCSTMSAASAAVLLVNCQRWSVLPLIPSAATCQRSCRDPRIPSSTSYLKRRRMGGSGPMCASRIVYRYSYSAAHQSRNLRGCQWLTKVHRAVESRAMQATHGKHAGDTNGSMSHLHGAMKILRRQVLLMHRQL